MEGDAQWAVTAGSHGVHFAAGPGHTVTAPPGVEIRAVLPDESEMLPTLETLSEDGDIGGYRFVFDPPLPDGSIVYLNGSALCTVGPPEP